ncbi:MAG TPA: hypothetical protein VD932_02800 [Aquabacterium sp.]|nr:hypothetical protein [Aquabacterium sp.]
MEALSKIVEVERLEIYHPPDSKFHDGFQTYVIVDGKTGPQMDPPLYDQAVTLITKAGKPLSVIVEYRGGSVVMYRPKHFDLTLGDVHVAIDKDRNPCRISIGGYEPRCTELKITFRRGETVLVDCQFRPYRP